MFFIEADSKDRLCSFIIDRPKDSEGNPTGPGDALVEGETFELVTSDPLAHEITLTDDPLKFRIKTGVPLPNGGVRQATLSATLYKDGVPVATGSRLEGVVPGDPVGVVAIGFGFTDIEPEPVEPPEAEDTLEFPEDPVPGEEEG